jgi:hypothetical protein
VATSWDDDEPRPERARVGLRAAGAVAATVGAGGEVTVRAVEAANAAAPVWSAVRFPLLTALALALSQLPRRRGRHRDEPLTERPARSELSRHLDRRARRARRDPD